MKRSLFLFLLMLLMATTSAGAQAPDRRISDNDGDVLTINADGSIPVNLTGASLPTFGGTTVTAGNMLVADGNAFNSVALSGDVTVDAAGVATIPTGRVLLSEISGIDSAATTATAGNILIGNGTNFTSITSPITFRDNGTDGFVGLGLGAVPADLLSIQGTVNGAANHPSGNYLGRDNAGIWRYECIANGGSCGGFQFTDDTTSDFDSRWSHGTETFAFTSNVAAEVRVGIGTTNPQAGLDVVGHIRATGWTATAGRLLVGNGQEFNSVAFSGDLTLTSAGSLTIGSASVTNTSGNILSADAVKFNSVALGSGLGTRIVSGTNTACSTTCGSLARCLHGLDLTTGLVTCADNSADTCFCGP